MNFSGRLTGLLLGAVLGWCQLPSHAAGVPTLGNGGFETPVQSGGSSAYAYNPSGASWNFGGNSGIQRNSSLWGAANAPEGYQTAFLQSNLSQGSGVAGSLSQSATFSAGSYQITFQVAQRSYGSVLPLQLQVDGTAIGSMITPPSTSFALYTSPVFPVGAGSHTLTLAATSVAGDCTSFVDDVRVIQAATPSLANGGFESPVQSGGGGAYTYNPSNAGWTFVGNSGIQRNGSLWGATNAPEGSQTAFLQGNAAHGAGVLGTFSQALAFNAGSYQVQFQAALRAANQNQPIQLQLDGTNLGSTIAPTSSSFSLYTGPTFTVTTGNHTLSFLATNNSGDNSAMIDAVKIINAAATPTPTPTPTSAPALTTEFGVNLEGAEQNPGTDYYDYPNTRWGGAYYTGSMDYYKARGRHVVRLPLSWERMQPTLYSALDATQLTKLDSFLSDASARGMLVILDCHNYAKYNGQTIGSGSVDSGALADFWKRMAVHCAAKFAGNSVIYGYDLMNEPQIGSAWQGVAQDSITAIRGIDTKTAIFVEGDNWSHAYTWPPVNNGLLTLNDSSNNLVFEAHEYFDPDHSGTYSGNPTTAPTPQSAIDAVSPFVNWCKTNHVRGFLGEFAIPNSTAQKPVNDDAGWDALLDGLLSYLNTNGIGGTYWAGGTRWDPSERISIEPLSIDTTSQNTIAATADRPQMLKLKNYPG